MTVHLLRMHYLCGILFASDVQADILSFGYTSRSNGADGEIAVCNRERLVLKYQ